MSEDELSDLYTPEVMAQGAPDRESLPDIEDVREKVAREIEEMISYLVSTEDDEADAGAYYGDLFGVNVENVRKAETLSQLAAAVEDIFPSKIKMINDRFFDVKKGGVRQLFRLQYQSKKGATPPFEHPTVQYVFYKLIPQLNAYALVEKALTE